MHPAPTAPSVPVAVPPRVCVLGGGFGGLYTALYLAQKSHHRGQPCTITLVEPKERFLFTPLLYEVLTDELKPWEIAPAYSTLLAGTGIDHRRTWVTGVDIASHRVTLEAGEPLEYDYLVMALGSQERSVPVPGLAEYSYRFRSLADAIAVDERIHQLQTQGKTPLMVTVVGGGPSGVELSCKLADRLGSGGQVQLVERGDRILKSFSRRERRVALKALGRRRVTVTLATSVAAIGPDWITLSTLQGELTVAVDLVLWVAGTQPVSWPGEEPVSSTDWGQYIPQGSLQLPSHPEVFVVGDQAVMGWRRDRPAPQTAQAAYQAAATVAHNLVATMQGRALRPFRYLHLGDMITLGQGDALLSSFGLVIGGPVAALARQVVYLQRLPTWPHRWRVARFRLGQGVKWLLRPLGFLGWRGR